MQISLWYLAFIPFGKYPEGGVAGSDGSCIFFFFQEPPYFFICCWDSLHSHQHKGYFLHPHSHDICYVLSLICCHSDKGEVISHCSFKLHFSEYVKRCSTSVKVLISPGTNWGKNSRTHTFDCECAHSNKWHLLIMANIYCKNMSGNAPYMCCPIESSHRSAKLRSFSSVFRGRVRQVIELHS